MKTFKIAKPLAIVIIALLLFIITKVLVKIVSLSYLEFSYVLMLKFDKLDKLDKFRSEILTPLKFNFIIGLLILIPILIVGFIKRILLFLTYQLNSFLDFIAHLSYICIQLWKSISAFQSYVVISVFIGLIIFKGLIYWFLPLNIDELFSFVHLSSKGFVVTSSYYPGPNNHVFYNQLVAILYQLNVTPKLAIRLPSMLSGLMLYGLIFFYFLYRSNYYLAILVSVLCSFSMPIMSFTIQGRGYGLQLLCFSISLLSAVEWQKYGSKKYSVTVFTISSILGFYIIPTYLYLFTTLICFLVVKVNKSNLFTLFKQILIVVFVTVGLYSPLVLMNGFQSILQNNWVKPIAFDIWISTFQAYIIDLNSYVWGFDISFSYILTLVLIGFMIYFKNLRWWILFFILPIVLIAIQGVLPFVRVFTFYSGFIFGLTAFFIYMLFQKLSIVKFSLIVLILFIIVNVLEWSGNEVFCQTVYDKKVEMYIAGLPKNEAHKYLVLDEKLGLEMCYMKISNPNYSGINVDFVKNDKVIYDKVFDQIE